MHMTPNGKETGALCTLYTVVLAICHYICPFYVTPTL
jgi:hypothetical protein